MCNMWVSAAKNTTEDVKKASFWGISKLVSMAKRILPSNYDIGHPYFSGQAKINNQMTN